MPARNLAPKLVDEPFRSSSLPLSGPLFDSVAPTPVYRSKELLLEEPPGDPARARFGAGIAKPCTPPTYDAKGFELTEFARRVGDLVLPSLEVDPKMGDLDLVADVNGEDDDAKASNPVRLTPVGVDVEDSPSFCVSADMGVDGVCFVGPDVGIGVDEDFDDAKRFFPCT